MIDSKSKKGMREEKNKKREKGEQRKRIEGDGSNGEKEEKTKE